VAAGDRQRTGCDPMLLTINSQQVVGCIAPADTSPVLDVLFSTSAGVVTFTLGLGPAGQTARTILGSLRIDTGSAQQEGTVSGIYELCGGVSSRCSPRSNPATITLVNQTTGESFTVEAVHGTFTATVPPGAYTVSPVGVNPISVVVRVSAGKTTEARIVAASA
jgi:hypothetical protein